MYLQEVGWGGVKLISLAQGTDSWRWGRGACEYEYEHPGSIK
jgi:hypothetical protein